MKRDSSSILADIDETRAKMDSTIDELTDRLAPSHLLDDLVGSVRRRLRSSAHAATEDGSESGLARAGMRAWEVVRDDPLPSLIIAAGAVLMIAQSRAPKAPQLRYPPGRRRTEPSSIHGASGGPYVDARTGEPHETSTLTNPGSEREHSMRDTDRNFGDRGREYIERGRESAEHLGERLRERASHIGDNIHHGYEQAKSSVGRLITERPLAIAAGALAAGVIVGLLIPRTRGEARYLGRLAQQAKDRGREMGHEVVERGGRVAEKTMDAFAEEAQRQGLTPEALLDRMRTVGSTSGR